MKKLISLLNSLFLTGCTVFGIRSAEEPVFQVLLDFGSIQIRQYPTLVVAETTVNADYKNSSSLAFQRLAGYIFGKNQKQQQMSMTAPVIQEKSSETLAMTTPVLQQKDGSNWQMSFVLPQGYSAASAPTPVDNTILIMEIPAKKVAVIEYSGRLSEQGIAEHATVLQHWLCDHDYKSISAPRSAAYDPPWTLPFLRRNEIQIDIE